ncbi:MAG: DUF4446 family protein [Lachnospiraceae bacterium]|nr:DUF4446 family protein [Lachnospiraceae bacterium]
MQKGYSKLFDSLGLGIMDIGIPILILFILLVILIIIAIIAIVKMVKMEKRLNAFLCGKDGMSLEESILSVHEENKYLKSCSDRNKKDIRILYKKAERTLSKVGLVKYDAFQQMGGQLSFSLALLDEHNDGFIINSVHGTDGCYSYTKEIKEGSCKLALGKEEEKALTLAIQYQNE